MHQARFLTAHAQQGQRGFRPDHRSIAAFLLQAGDKPDPNAYMRARKPLFIS